MLGRGGSSERVVIVLTFKIRVTYQQKMGLFRNNRIANRDVQVTAKPPASPTVFMEKEEVGSSCFEGKHQSTVVMGPQWLSCWDGGLQEKHCTLFPPGTRN